MSDATPRTDGETLTGAIQRRLPELLVEEYGEDVGTWTELGSVRRIAADLALLVDRAASTVHTDDRLRAGVEAVLATWDRQVSQFSDVTARLAIAGCADDLRAVLAPTAPEGNQEH